MKYCTQGEKVLIWSVVALAVAVILIMQHYVLGTAIHIVEGIKAAAKERFLLDCKECDESKRNFVPVEVPAKDEDSDN